MSDTDELDLFLSSLMARGTISEASLKRAQRAAIQTDERLDHVIVKLGILPEQAMLEGYSEYFGIPLITSDLLPISPVAEGYIDINYIRWSEVLPIRYDQKQLLVVAIADPLKHEPLKALSYLLDCEVSSLLLAKTDLEKTINALYPSEALSKHEQKDDEASQIDIQRLHDLASEAPIIRLVNQLIADAVAVRASDLHFEAGLDELVLRFRIDGVLHLKQKIERRLRDPVISRIKIMAKLDIAEHRLPQDGRMKLNVRGLEIDCRVSTMPTAYGESVVLRLLNASQVALDFNLLGFGTSDIKKISTLLNEPNGIILVTGPTGSGKTTTLYTALKKLSTISNKVFTVEDPVEYQLPGISQIQVQKGIDFDFPRALRSILRQDPDVIMIGEIRDVETAKIAFQAALTGHLVLSTLHTNSAISAISRLVDMGIERYLISSTVKGVVAQRLVRRRCSQCSLVLNEADSAQKIEKAQTSSAGCESCGFTGFEGRLTVAEVLIPNNAFCERLNQGWSEHELEKLARESGLRSMYEDGMCKVDKGVTTLEEVLRVTKAV